MKIGIDGSNLRAGGGVRHIVELLAYAKPQKHAIDKIVIWGGKALLSQLPDKPWLEKSHQPLLDRSLLFRLYWQYRYLKKLAASCDLLFSPGGMHICGFFPFVTMSQNLIPFDWKEIKRYGFSWQFLRNVLLRVVQSRSYKQANGLIFLSDHAKQKVSSVIGDTAAIKSVIPHGVHINFSAKPKQQKKMSDYSTEYPFQLLYISSVDMYKHQWHCCEAVAKCRQAGFPVQLTMIGDAYPPALERLERCIQDVDPEHQFINYLGLVDHTELTHYYQQADAFIFASSCETFGQILVEAMASGLPIACAERSAMPEVLKEGGYYFDPEDSDSIYRTLQQMLNNPEQRAQKAKKAHERAKQYCWKKCADETLQFLSSIVS